MKSTAFVSALRADFVSPQNPGRRRQASSPWAKHSQSFGLKTQPTESTVLRANAIFLTRTHLTAAGSAPAPPATWPGDTPAPTGPAPPRSQPPRFEASTNGANGSGQQSGKFSDRDRKTEMAREPRRISRGPASGATPCRMLKTVWSRFYADRRKFSARRAIQP